MVAALFLCALIQKDALPRDEWPQWRGPNRDGVVSGFVSPKTWPASLKRQWSVPVGDGYASPVVGGARAYQFARRDDREHVYCLEPATGKIVWEKSYRTGGRVHRAAADHGIGPKSTPVIAEGKLYTLGIDSVLSCWDARSGALVWREDFAGRYPAPAPSCGTSMSPLIVGGLCVVYVGLDRKGGLIGIDAETGKERWRYDEEGPGYGSPILASLGGRRQLIVPVSRAWAGFDPQSGKRLWRFDFPTDSSQNIITPVVHRDTLIVGGIGQPLTAIRLRSESEGFTVETVWKNDDVPVHMSSPVLAGGLLFGLSRKRSGHLFCVDAATGKTLWQEAGRFSRTAALLAVNQQLAVLSSEGTLVFADAGRSGFERLASYTVDPDRSSWAHPALIGKRILVKAGRHLACWTID